MANTAVQLAANTEVNEVSERMSHCTTVSFTLAPEPPSLPPIHHQLLEFTQTCVH